MPILRIVCMIFAILSLSCGSFTAPTPQPVGQSSPRPADLAAQAEFPSDIEDDEYLVYGALAQGASDLRSSAPANARVAFVITDHTKPPHIEEQMLSRVRLEIPQIDDSTVADFVRRNESSYPIEHRIATTLPYVLLSDLEFKQILAHDRGMFAAFFWRYPGVSGIAGLSRVGFSADRNQALAYADHTCGTLCGGDALYLLSRQDGVWSIVSVRPLSVS